MSLLSILKESTAPQFTNWRKPNQQELELEFHVEHELKGNDFFESEEAFLDACAKGIPTTITPQMDRKIAYRSRTTDKEDLLYLIRSYRSYPEFRNEKTLDALYEGFRTNKPMTMPIVLKFAGGSMRVFSGNTRMDVAFQLGIDPVVLMVQADN